MEPIQIKYSAPLIRRAMRAYWRKRVGRTYPLVAVVLTALLLYRLALGDRSWVVGALAAVIVLAVAVVFGSYYVNLRNSLKRLRRMNAPEATLSLSERHFRVTSDIGSSEVAWSLVTELWCFDNVWLVFFSASEFMTLPIVDVPPEAQALIIAKAKAQGAKIF